MNAHPIVTFISVADMLTASVAFCGPKFDRGVVRQVMLTQCGMCAFPIGIGRAVLVDGHLAYHADCYSAAVN